MYATLGAILGLSISSAINSFQNNESDNLTRFSALAVLSLIALVMLFIREG